MIKEEEILPELCYLLLDCDFNENQLSIIIDYEFGIPRNTDELETEYDFVILENPIIDEKTINEIKDLIDSEIEIDLEIENNQKRIRIWNSAAEIQAKISCEDYKIKKQVLSKDQWIRRYKKLIKRFYYEIDNGESKRVKIRDFKNKAEHQFKNEFNNTIKKLEFYKDQNKDVRILETKKELLSTFLTFLGLIDEYFD